MQKMTHSMLSFLSVLIRVLINNLLCEIVHFHADQKPFHVDGFCTVTGFESVEAESKGDLLYQMFEICRTQM